MFTGASLDGVYSHGVHRFARIVAIPITGYVVVPKSNGRHVVVDMAMDLIAAILSAGFTTTDIGKKCTDEQGLSQVFIAITPGHFNTPEFTDQIIDAVLQDVNASIPAYDGAKIRYPGERAFMTRLDNMEKGIPVLP